MLVKNIPIFQGFPSIETVKKLSKATAVSGKFSPVFYDIETTGLSRYSTFLYLVGAIWNQNGSWQLRQWMAEDPSEEQAVLEAFCAFLKDFSCTIQYNGDAFDQPYLESRLQVHGLSSPFADLPSLDLYKKIKPLKGLLKLPGLKQGDIEHFLHIKKRDYCNGGQCIRLYQKYLTSRSPELLAEVMGHNQEDLLGLGRVFEMLSYLCLLDGRYLCTEAQALEGQLILRLELPHALPAEFSNGNEELYITGCQKRVSLSSQIICGRVRQHYANYKDYDYIPAEDTAIPKVLSRFMDRSLRQSATLDTSYTWFPCTDDFLSDSQKQMQFLHHALNYLCRTLNRH